MTTIIDGSAGITFPSGSNPQAAPSKVLQVVNVTYSTQVSNTTQTFVDTGLTATITPLFSTSKILVLLNQNGVTTSTTSLGVAILLYRNASSLNTVINYAQYGTASTDASVGTTYLDSPATTSATTYKVQASSGLNTAIVYIGGTAASIDATQNITLLEIAG